MNLVKNRFLDECTQIEEYGEQSRGELEEGCFEHFSETSMALSEVFPGVNLF
jgi:hypothetical protein